MAGKKILFIVPHRLNRCPGQRFRFEQYTKYLENNGYKITISNLLSRNDDRNFYKSGNYFAKMWIALKSIGKRTFDFFRLFRYDIVFIYREAIMFGSSMFERLYSLTPAKMIFDFDDSIWLNDTSEGNKNLSWLKNPAKTATIAKLADTVIVGNQYLADYARQFNNNVVIIPTTIDLSYHKPIPRKPNDSICIGWTGTSTTLKHFRSIEPILEKIKDELGNRITFSLICDADYQNPRLGLHSQPWCVDTEIEDLCRMDIGIMPLPDDKWSKGKCGFKGLQYMSLHIPTIMSPVGVNKEIICDGENGFLASTESEWHDKLLQLIDSEELRRRLGDNGFHTIKESFSVESQRNRYLEIFDNLIQKN